MDKIWVVTKSEFLRRVRSKWFVIITLLGPVLLIGLMVAPSLLAVLATENDTTTVAVIDETGVLMAPLTAAAGDRVALTAVTTPEDSVRAAVRAGDYDGYLVLPASLADGEGQATFYSAVGGGLSLGERLERYIDKAVEQQRLEARQADPGVLAILETDIRLERVKLTEDGETEDAAAASSIIGLVMGFFIYMAMFVYGAYVMHGVMEEKQSRVVEIVVSAVQPFQLLMGKVLGIGLMGLVQMGVWALFMFLATVFAGSIAALFLDPADFGLAGGASQEELLAAAEFAVPQIDPMFFLLFIVFFLGGYLIYASFYAAVGSAVDNQQDAQGLMAPVVLLIILPMMLITFVVESPNSTLSVVLSLIPFFSPILMVVRAAATEVPFWQMALSILLLVGGFVTTIWVSSRIYRVGILMYGKKPSLKDLARWMRYA